MTQTPTPWARLSGSVRFRITFAVVVIVSLALAAGGVMLLRWVQASLVAEARERNERVLVSMADTLDDPGAGAALVGDPELLEARLARALTAGSGAGDDMMDSVGRTYLYIAVPGRLVEVSVRGEDDRGRVVLETHEVDSMPLGDEAIEVERAVPGAAVPLTVYAVTPLAGVDGAVAAFGTALVLVLPLLVLFAGALTWAITGRALAPVAAMTKRVRELGAQNLDGRVPVSSGSDEVAQLGRTMNEMLERLERSAVSQRQFVSDASHELRSPVTSIRVQLETALARPEAVDWPEVGRVVLAEDERLEHLVSNLLAMARFDEGLVGARIDVDVDEIVFDQARRLQGVCVDVSRVGAGRVRGNRDEITSVVRNLCDNAVRHAHSVVRVELPRSGRMVVLTVSDDGSGVPPERRERIFERFARLQEGRERDSGGAGLGLALTRRIVEAHQGSIHVESDEALGGARFVVAIPGLLEEPCE